MDEGLMRAAKGVVDEMTLGCSDMLLG